jgi:hypothetical protein
LSKKHNLPLKCLRAGYLGFGNITKTMLKIVEKSVSRGALVSVLVRRLVVVSSWISKHRRNTQEACRRVRGFTKILEGLLAEALLEIGTVVRYCECFCSCS